MYTNKQEVGIGLAHLYARDRKQMPDRESFEWAKEHRLEFRTVLRHAHEANVAPSGTKKKT